MNTAYQITAMFPSTMEAERAADSLVDAGGVTRNTVNVYQAADATVMQTLKRHSPFQTKRDEYMSTGLGVTIGLVLGGGGGALFGLLMSLGVLPLPGREPFMALDPFMGLVVGGLIFGVLGGAAGFFFNSPLPTLEPDYTLREGNDQLTILQLAADSAPSADLIESIKEAGATQVSVWHRSGDQWVPAA